MIVELSSVTASSTAAISSASGGSGMYSFAPALMARTASAGSLPIPHPTTGTMMRSAARLATSVAMSSCTSAMIMSAPCPARSELSADGISGACDTVAPRDMAILLAAPICPLREPIMSRRMLLLPFDGRSAEIRDPPGRRQHRVQQQFQTARIVLAADGFGRQHVDVGDQDLRRGIAFELRGEGR